MGFPSQVTVKAGNIQWDGTCKIEVVWTLLKEAGNQRLGASIDKCQTAVADWLTLRPIYKVCNKEAGYERRGR